MNRALARSCSRLADRDHFLVCPSSLGDLPRVPLGTYLCSMTGDPACFLVWVGVAGLTLPVTFVSGHLSDEVPTRVLQ